MSSHFLFRYLRGGEARAIGVLGGYRGNRGFRVPGRRGVSEVREVIRRGKEDKTLRRCATGLFGEAAAGDRSS